jgi:C-terminal processing protease CtpA/Prc
MKNYITVCLLAFFCAVSISSLSAQDKKVSKKVVVVEKTVDADGNVSKTRTVKEGEEAEAYIKEMDSESDAKWITKDEVEIEVSKSRSSEKKYYKMVVKDDAGNEKVLEWNGEGEMPEEMEALMEEHDVHDVDNASESKVVIIKNEGGEKNVFELKLEDGEFSEEMEEMLKEHGVDIEMIKDENGNIEVIVETEEQEKNNNKAQLGVMVENNTNGAKITDFMKGSPAQNAGLQSGDVITHVNNERVNSIEELVVALSEYKPNDIITINFIRGDIIDSKEITLQERTELYEHKSWDDVMKDHDKKSVTKKKTRVIVKEKN